MLTIPAGPSFHSRDPVDRGSPPTVEALLQSVRAGDERAAVTLHERIYPLVVRIIRSHLPPRTSEEDLCQIVFARIFHRLHQYSGLAPFEHWVSRVAINVCLNQIETERIRPELRYADLSLEERKAVKQFASSFAEIPEEQSELAREVVTTLLLKLEPEDRLVITMLHLEKRSIAEIASYTGRTAGVIKTRAYRARQKLKRLHGQLIKQNLRETCSHSAGTAFQPEEIKANPPPENKCNQ